ncbi:hypothetical protein [Granulicella paludicola]|uniref:hypothetical protein n=1 Tax=Granulicella paludicola TaxID=474951 RepID=UPI0021DF8BE4|nr:hypothetical protein [Granulicella paludicola]
MPFASFITAFGNFTNKQVTYRRSSPRPGAADITVQTAYPHSRRWHAPPIHAPIAI